MVCTYAWILPRGTYAAPKTQRFKKKLCYYYCSCCCVCVHADVHVCKPRVHVEAKVQIWGVDSIFYLYGSYRRGTQVTRLARQASLPTEPFHQPHWNNLAFTFVSFDQVLPGFQSSVWPTGGTFNGLKTYSIHSRCVFSFRVRVMKERHSHAVFNNTRIYLYEILRSFEDRSPHWNQRVN